MNDTFIPDPLGISGTTIAEKYKIGPVVGEGGFSVVYKAEHTIWQQPVAIKCFKALANAPQERRSELLDEFIQEGKLMAALSSRSAAIVQARDVGTFTAKDGAWIPYMVLEWLDGSALDAILEDEHLAGLPPRKLPEVMALLEPAAIALNLVHSKNIAHRDVKPANIMVSGDPRGPAPFVKVLDFGIAKVMAEHAQDATALAQTGKEITVVHADLRRARAVQPHARRDRPVDRRLRHGAHRGGDAARGRARRSRGTTTCSSPWRAAIHCNGRRPARWASR